MQPIASSYEEQVRSFAELGAKIYRLNPARHYKTGIGKTAKRPMEPGFIPIDKPAKVVTVSYYPNESELPTSEFDAYRRSLAAWGASGSVSEYVTAYRDWLSTLPDVPFYRDFNAPIFKALGIGIDEYAWLSLIKLPLPAGTKVPEDDIWVDRMLLWDQLLLLKPPVILAQGGDAYKWVSAMCEDKFPNRVVSQKIGRVGTTAYHTSEDARVIEDLRNAMKAIIS